jgi:hypothetical protein
MFGRKMKRELSVQERDWLTQGLHSMATGEYRGGGIWVDLKTGKTVPKDDSIDPAPYLEQVPSLQIVGQCSCGDSTCHTVRFQNYAKGRSIALAQYHTDDGRMLIIHVNEDTGKIAELEII